MEDINRSSDINLDVLSSVFDRINKTAGFHSLRTLEIFDDPEATYQHQLHLFPTSTPNLVDLKFYVGNVPEISAATFLYTISSESRNLKSLVLGNGPWTKTILDVLPCFRKLQLLEIQELDCHNPVDFLKTCALSMASLRSLSVSLLSVGDFGQPGVSRDLGLITLGLLSILDLTGYFRDVENMLNILFVPKLDTLRLDFQCEDEMITGISPFIEGFLTTNGQHLKDGLRTLDLRTDSTRSSIENYLHSFKAFIKLDSLHIRPSGFQRDHLSASGLASFLHENKPWSDLTCIYLDGGHVRVDLDQIDDTLSIATLPLLADTFPKLLHLVISICNPDQAAMKTVTMDATRTPHGLETLRFICELPQDWIYSTSSAVAFASFLHQLFPKLKEVACYNRSEWINEVQEMLKKEERASCIRSGD